MYIYYVYAYLRKSNNTPYYIGKGKGNRLYSPHGWLKIPKDKSKIIILESNLSEIGAFALERRYIRWYGRKDLNNGILLNKSDGGEGPSGVKRSKELIENLRNHNTGRKLSIKHKQKISNSKKGCSGFIGSHTEESKNKIRDRMKQVASRNPKQLVICPHCGKTGGKPVMNRYHFDKCKFKKY